MCDRHDILLIADEVMSGFGRTGKWFACELHGVVPDMIATAKGITAGYLPLGATCIGNRYHRQDYFNTTRSFLWDSPIPLSIRCLRRRG